MDLTPVKIRGKRKRPGTKSDLQESLAPSSSQAKRLSGRTPQKLAKANKVKEIVMPTLQGLPQELLEMIFLYSMTISLPRASPTLGRRLSSKAVILEFVMRSFFHTVDTRTNDHDHDETSDAEIQSQLLACRFFTWDFFRCYVTKARTMHIQRKGEDVKVPGLEAFDSLWPFRFMQVTFMGFAEGFYIPEKVLHGPWSTGRASLLYVLVSLNGRIDWQGSMAGEIAKAGLRHAIEENNERAVAALAVLLGIAQAIDTSIIRRAVVDCGCNINIVRQLLYNAQILHQSSPAYSLNFYDPTLWRWADAHEGKGVLLKDLLRKADKFSLDFYLEGEDAVRAKIVPFPYGGAKFDPRGPLNIMNREFLVRLYRNHGRKITSSPPRRRRRNPEMGHTNGEEHTNGE